MSVNIVAYSYVMSSLNRPKGATINEACEASGLTKKTVSKIVAALRARKPCLVFICGWEKSGWVYARRWKSGDNEEDEDKPEIRSKAKIARDWYERKKISEGKGPPSVRKAKLANERKKRIYQQSRDPVTNKLISKNKTA